MVAKGERCSGSTAVIAQPKNSGMPEMGQPIQAARKHIRNLADRSPQVSGHTVCEQGKPFQEMQYTLTTPNSRQWLKQTTPLVEIKQTRNHKLDEK